MALVEAVIVGTGGVLAKAVVKLWLGDSSVANDISSSLGDLLQKATSDIFEQRQAERQFQDIGEKVAKDLLPLFQRESRIDESSAIAVANAVTETFGSTPLTADLVITNNVESSLLAAYFLEHAPRSNQMFGDVEHRLYERSIREACRYIVEISSRLPSFSERAFSQVLSRQTQLLAAVDDVIREMRGIRDYLEESDAEVDRAYFEAEYRTTIRRQLNRVYLFGIDISELNRQQNLSVAYVTLSAKRNALYLKSDKVTSSQEDQELPVDRVLRGVDRLLVVGRAGSGKTTLLKWIAVMSALQRFPPQLDDWNTKIPFFIRLRKFEGQDLPIPDSFPSLLHASLSASMPKNWVRDQLKRGRGILLVDGIDELSDVQHHRVREWLEELLIEYPDNIYILTSRPHAVVSERWSSWLQRRRFQTADLQPMDLPSIRTFITNWHDAVAAELADTESRGLLTFQENQLLEAVQHNLAIRNIATSPLLCAMICALHRERHHLPSDRIDLYESCTKMLLYERERERDISLKEYPQLGHRQQIAILRDVAYWFQKNGKSEADRAKVLVRIEHAVSGMRDLRDNVEPYDIYRLLKDRSGMLVEPTVSSVSFTHQTFQEYFAAQAVLEEEDIGLLVSRAHDRRWRETIILTAGQANFAEQRELIQGMVARGEREDNVQRYLFVLAISCLETVTRLDPSLESTLNNLLERLTPPRSLSEAVDLAAAGELVLPFLHSRDFESDETAAACVRAIVLVGGPAALDVLEGYATDKRATVVAELARGFDFFDHDEYARRILSAGQHASLTLSTSSLEGLQHLPMLRELDLTKCRRVADLSPLTSLANLAKLDLSGLDLAGADLQVLGQIPQLTSLNLAHARWGVSSGEEENSTSARFGGTSKTITDIRFLVSITRLTELDLSYIDLTNGNLSVLTSLPNLKTLRLSGANLQQAELSGLNISDVDFEGAILVETDLSNSILRYAKFDRADLERAELSGADLYGASFRYANLWCASLIGSNLQRVDMTGANLEDIDGDYSLAASNEFDDIEEDGESL